MRRSRSSADVRLEFPIEKLWTIYPELLQAHRNAVARHGTIVEADVFWTTAAKIYRL